jgi:hypothetical protein
MRYTAWKNAVYAIPANVIIKEQVNSGVFTAYTINLPCFLIKFTAINFLFSEGGTFR